MQLDEALGVGEVVGDEGVVHHGDVVELVLGLGDDGLPVIALGMVEIDGDDLAVGRVERGADPEGGAVVVDDAVERVGMVTILRTGASGWSRSLMKRSLLGLVPLTDCSTR